MSSVGNGGDKIAARKAERNIFRRIFHNMSNVDADTHTLIYSSAQQINGFLCMYNYTFTRLQAPSFYTIKTVNSGFISFYFRVFPNLFFYLLFFFFFGSESFCIAIRYPFKRAVFCAFSVAVSWEFGTTERNMETPQTLLCQVDFPRSLLSAHFLWRCIMNRQRHPYFWLGEALQARLKWNVDSDLIAVGSKHSEKQLFHQNIYDEGSLFYISLTRKFVLSRHPFGYAMRS